MPTLDDVYRKFGETAEAAQLLETDLGTIALMIGCTAADLLENPDSQKATEIYQRINRQTLGQLLKNVRGSNGDIGSSGGPFRSCSQGTEQVVTLLLSPTQLPSKFR